MLNRYATIINEADALGWHREADEIDVAMLRLAQAVAPVGLTWEQYVQDIYRKISMLSSKMEQMQLQSSQADSSRAKSVPSLQEQTGIQTNIQPGNPAKTTYNLNDQSHDFDIMQ